MCRRTWLWIALIHRTCNLCRIVHNRLIVLPTSIPCGKGWENAICIKDAFTLMIPRTLAGNGRKIAYISTTSSNASFYIGGSSLPRRSARRRIPSQARLLKKHFTGASGCKIDDKVDAISSLGHAPVFRSLNAPCEGVMISHDLAGVKPFSFRRLRN